MYSGVVGVLVAKRWSKRKADGGVKRRRIRHRYTQAQTRQRTQRGVRLENRIRQLGNHDRDNVQEKRQQHQRPSLHHRFLWVCLDARGQNRARRVDGTAVCDTTSARRRSAAARKLALRLICCCPEAGGTLTELPCRVSCLVPACEVRRVGVAVDRCVTASICRTAAARLSPTSSGGSQRPL